MADSRKADNSAESTWGAKRETKAEWDKKNGAAARKESAESQNEDKEIVR